MIPQNEIEKYQEENLLFKEQIEERSGKTVEQLYAERAKRIRDVIELREPDRVPFLVLIDTHVHYEIPNSTAYYDPLSRVRNNQKLWSVLNRNSSGIKQK